MQKILLHSFVILLEKGIFFSCLLCLLCLLICSLKKFLQIYNFFLQSYEECKSIANVGTAQLVDKDGEAAYKVEYKKEITVVTVQEVCTKYIKSLRESAENFLGQSVTGAVLAIPTY